MDYRKTLEEVRQYYFTVLFVVLNIIAFLICTFTGNLLYNKGAFYIWYAISEKEYYRILTSVFLHADVEHIFNNMILLFFMGRIVEKQIGHVAYFVVYILSGIGGNILSGLWELKMGQYSFSVGASGAVFGLMGALLVMVLSHKGRVEQINWKGVVVMILLSVYNGFSVDNINNAAHLGGLLVGTAVSALVWLIGRIKVEN